eukprot:1191986-Prorocentrum_minimum.AAC.4
MVVTRAEVTQVTEGELWPGSHSAPCHGTATLLRRARRLAVPRSVRPVGCCGRPDDVQLELRAPYLGDFRPCHHLVEKWAQTSHTRFNANVGTDLRTDLRAMLAGAKGREVGESEELDTGYGLNTGCPWRTSPRWTNSGRRCGT